MMTELVTCETVAAIVLHVRRVADVTVRLGGHSAPRPLALCGRPVDWDTTQPVALEQITCCDCKAALAAELGLAVPGGPDADQAPAGPVLGPVRKLCERCRERPAVPHRPGPARCTVCVEQPASRGQDRRRRQPRARTISWRNLRREVRLHAEVTPTWAQATERPRTRGECREQERPCPWVRCKHHLYLDINPSPAAMRSGCPDGGAGVAEIVTAFPADPPAHAADREAAVKRWLNSTTFGGTSPPRRKLARSLRGSRGSRFA